MASVFNTAAYILKRHGGTTSMKLQKLVYYAQAWSLVWDERPLFKEEIQAWANGPVVPALFFAHQGEFTLTKEPRGDISKLDEDARDTINAIIEAYGDKSANWLSALTHREDPWVNARRGLADGERGNSVISHGALADYYGNL